MMKKTSTKKNPVAVPPVYDSGMKPVAEGNKLPMKWILLSLAALMVALLVINKGLFLAAVVEGRPIYTWELNKVMKTRYGQQTLEGMIGERLIAAEAQKSGIVITPDIIESKQKEILSSLGTQVSLEDFLKFQGLTKADFDQQLRIQITVEKLLTKNLTITEKDIDNYIATNRATLVATDPAQLREEARKSIVGNVVSEQLQQWFVGIREKAKIMKFL